MKTYCCYCYLIKRAHGWWMIHYNDVWWHDLHLWRMVWHDLRTQLRTWHDLPIWRMITWHSHMKYRMIYTSLIYDRIIHPTYDLWYRMIYTSLIYDGIIHPTYDLWYGMIYVIYLMTNMAWFNMRFTQFISPMFSQFRIRGQTIIYNSCVSGHIIDGFHVIGDINEQCGYEVRYVIISSVDVLCGYERWSVSTLYIISEWTLDGMIHIPSYIYFHMLEFIISLNTKQRYSCKYSWKYNYKWNNIVI